MTMIFRTVKTQILSILDTAKAGRYRVVGYNGQLTSVEEILNTNRRVLVRYNSGSFPESKSKRLGSVEHDITYTINLAVAKSAKVDLSVLENPNATALQRQTALAASDTAAEIAEDSIDEFIDIIYNILMDAKNYDMGLSIGTVTDRWISNIRKSDPSNTGEYEIITASMDLTCRVKEVITGDTSGVETDYIDTNNYNNDQALNAGVINSGEKNILTFSFGIVGEVVTIGNVSIGVVVPFGTDRSNLTPTFTVSEHAAPSPLSGVARDFTTPKTYTITALDGTIKIYTVTVTVASA